jgi:radical SAM protein with 4Fe4S-binding SPASM domain
MLSIVATGSNEKEVRRFKRYWRLRGVKATSVVFENKAGNVKLRGGELASNGLKAFSHCFRPFRTFYVLWNGDVIPCCADWGRKLILGNLRERSIHEIWHSEPFARLRGSLEKWDLATLPTICKACSKAIRTGAHHQSLFRSLADRVKGVLGYDRHRTDEEDELDGLDG